MKIKPKEKIKIAGTAFTILQSPRVCEGDVVLSAADWELCQKALAVYKEPEAEWKPFPGEIVEVSSEGLSFVSRVFHKMFGGVFVCEQDRDPEALYYWKYCRPLTNPLIIQFRPHDGKGMPEEAKGKKVCIMRRDGYITTHSNASILIAWQHTGEPSDIIGWCLVDRQGAGE